MRYNHEYTTNNPSAATITRECACPTTLKVQLGIAELVAALLKFLAEEDIHGQH